MTVEDPYGDDETHPIPFMGKIDVFVTTKEGSVYYGLVIASAMTGDKRSQQRLLRKIEDYLSDRRSDELLGKYGQATPQNTTLKVAIHPGCDHEVFELLERCKLWVEDNGFTFEVSTDARILSLH